MEGLIATSSDMNLLDEVADMSVPRTIDYKPDGLKPDSSYENGQSTKDDRQRKVISPDGTSTVDGSSTIGSAVSEPTTETASRTSRASSMRGNGKKSSRKSGGGGGGGSGSRTKTSYRSSYSSNNRMQNSNGVRGGFQVKRAGPLSYSKTVRLGGAGTNFSAREVDDKTRAVLADMNDFDANQCETE